MAPQPPPLTADTPLNVRVLTRVVAAGVITRGGVQYLRASLCFLPQPDHAGDIDLKNWPKEIKEKLGQQVVLNVLPLNKAGPVIAPQPDEEGYKTSWTRLMPDRSDEDIAYLNDLWRRLVAPTLTIHDLDRDGDSYKVLNNFKKYYTDAVNAFNDPWGQLDKAIRISLGGGSGEHVEVRNRNDRLPAVMAVPVAEAATSLAGMRLYSTIQTLRREDRHAAAESTVFHPRLLRNEPPPPAPATKLGRLAAGERRIDRVVEQGTRNLAIAWALKRNVLATRRMYEALLDDLGRQQQNLRERQEDIPTRTERRFNSRHRRDQDERPSWLLGQPRDPSAFPFSEVLKDEDFINDLRRSLGDARESGAAIADVLTNKLHGYFAGRAGDTLLQHMFTMRHVERELSLTQQEEVWAKSKDELDLDARRVKQGKEISQWRKLNRASQEIVDAAGRRFFGLQSFPTLARMLNLVVDVEIPLSEFRSARRKFMEERVIVESDLLWDDSDESVDFDASAVTPSGDGREVENSRADYFLLAHITGNEKIWSTTKLRAGKDAKRDGHFWPVTCEEIDIKRKEKGIAPQHDGVIDLGFARNGRARYQLENLDVIHALETTISGCEGEQAAIQGGAPIGRAGRGWGQFRTGGLALIDTMRGDAVASDVVKTALQTEIVKTAPTILDANDLMIGYRVDIGVRPRDDSAHRFVWRSLMNRRVEYLDPSSSARAGELKKLHAQLGLDDEAILRLDSGLLRLPTKLIVDDPRADSASKQAQAIANEKMIQWPGNLLGVECSGDAKHDSMPVDPARDLMLAITYRQPSQQNEEKSHPDSDLYLPPRLEFGRGYRVGLRAVYLGGVVLPLPRAAAIYEKGRGGELTLPPRGSKAHRFLRHESIDPPLVAIAEQVLSVGRHRDMPWDPGEWAIVRTGKDPRLGPKTTWRVVVPPAVSMDYAVLHRISEWKGTVPTGRQGGRRLVGGLVNVDINEELGGFPSLDAGRTDLKHFKLDTSKRPASKEPVYDAVFKVKATSNDELGRRQQPYFPDPAAKTLIVEVVGRRTDGKRKDMISVPLSEPKANVHYPDYLPVVIEVEALDAAVWSKRATILRWDPALDDGVIVKGGEFKHQSRATWANWSKASGTVRARRVVVSLGPGEDYDLRLWCAPTHDDLARWFQTHENHLFYARSMGQVASATDLTIHADKVASVLNDIGVTTRVKSPTDAAVVRGMLALYGDDLVGAAVQRSRNRRGRADAGATAEVTVDGVHPRLFAFAADFVADRAHEVPLPGFSKARTIRVTHAVQQPRLAPCFIQLGNDAARCVATEDGATALAVARKEFKDAGVEAGSADTVTADSERAKWLFANRDPTQWKTLPLERVDEGALDTVFGGRVAIDLDTSSHLALRASVALTVDDVTRKRDRKNPLPNKRQTSAIYGFTVEDDGRVTFADETIEVLRTRDLTDEIPQKGPEDLEILDLAFAPGDTLRTFEYRHRFRQPTARKLLLRLEARSRFEHYLVREGGALPTELTQLGSPVSLWLPASKRPDPIDRKSLLPAFVWTEKAHGSDVERRVLVRIRMKRPWFSSGAGERVGIVLWPPELIDPKRRDDIARDIAFDPVKSTTGKTEYREYKDFDDSDLGPGGQFITRWGADPIRRGPVQMGFFMPLEAFRDAFPDQMGSTGAKLVPNVQMPVPPGDPNDSGCKASAASKPITMMVSLLAYEPRFDVIDESWYVDAEISPLALTYPFVRLGLVRYQEHAPAEWRVSEPIVEFTQLLPRRHVVVTVKAAHAGQHPVQVDVYGPAADVVSLKPEDENDAGSNADALQRPILKARVLRASPGVKGANPTDLPVPEVIAVGKDGRLLKWDSASEAKFFQPRRDEPGLQWSFQFALKDDPKVTPHYILIEEVEWMLATDPVAERRRQGLPAGADSVVAESGPKFALKVRVPRNKSDSPMLDATP